MPADTHESLYEQLFSPGTIGTKKTVNRFTAQPMEANDGELDGSVSQRALDRYAKLAQGRWGITVVEAVSITEDSRARVNGLVISRKNLDSFRRLVDTFRAYHPEGILLFQITHAGRKAGPTSRKAGMYEDGSGDVHILSDAEVEEVRQGFLDAADLAWEAGADGIDFKICHGYLGSEMLRPANLRDGKWGGSFENRTLFLFSSIRELKKKYARSGFIVGSRVSMFEGIRGGCGTADGGSLIEDLTEMKQIISGMAQAGADYINVSAGIPGVTSEITRPTNQSRWFFLHHFRYCREAREAAGNAALIGSAYTILKEQACSLAEENLTKGLADFIGFGRQVFADPLYPEKVRTGRQPDYCISCSGCTRLMIRQVNDGCMVYDPYYKQLAKETFGR